MRPLYESLPFDTSGRFVDKHDNEVSLDLFQLEPWYNWRLGVFTRYPDLMESPEVRAFLIRMLERGRRFQQAMRHPWPDEFVEQVHLIASRSYQTMRCLRLTPTGVDLWATRRKVGRARWHPRVDPKWVERGDWFAPWESLTGLAHRPEHLHEVDCIHRHLFSDTKAQQALVQTLKRD